MLGKFVRVRITNPVGSLNRQYGYRYSLNFGSLEGRRQFDNRFAGAYIMGIHHPVRHFDGRAIAVLYREGERKGILVVAPKNMRFIGYQIADALAFATARREVLEETGIHIDIIPDFTAKSDYTIQGKVEKSVTIFLAKTEDTETIIQREEIDDYIWLGFDKALETLKFENDKAILKSARRFMDKHGIFETDD